MKLFVIVFAIVGLALTAAAEPVNIDYHEDFGIPAATRIKYAEQARDFDGNRVLGGQLSNLGQNPHFVSYTIPI